MRIKLEISYIKVSGRTIRFNNTLKFRVVPDPIVRGNLYIEDNFFYIHETAPTFAQLVDQVRDALAIQYEGIALQNDSNLSDSSIALKKYFISNLKEKEYRYVNHVTFKYKKNNSINKGVK